MIFSKAWLFSAAAAVLLGWVAPTPAASPSPLPPGEEAALFSFADLGPVDLGPKRLTVEVYISPDAELADCRRLFAQVWQQVQVFYARLGVLMEEAPGQREAGPVAPARRLRIELLTDKEWLDRSFKSFNVAYPFRLRFLQVCRDKCAFAHLNLSTVHISFKRFQKAQFSSRPEEEHLNRNWLANLMVHELGHLLGLYHTDEFVDDPVAVGHTDNGAPNFMSQQIAFKSALGFTEFQRRLVHSYLGLGKVYRQYQAVDFDPLRYLKLVKRVNGFKEPLSRVAKVAGGAGKKGKTRTFDGDDEDNEDD